MKKILYSIMVVAAATFSFATLTSCEDVPAPYEIPGTDGDGDDKGGGDVTPTTAETLPYTSTSLQKGWTAVTPKGVAWSLGSSYAKGSGYSGGTYTETEAWLVSPLINTTTSTGVIINFDYVIRYAFNTGDLANHKVLISKDYTGDVTTATWTELAFDAKESSTNDWTFYASNTISVPTEYLNTNVVVAFKFTCGTSSSTTWELQNFSMKEGTGGTQPSDPGTGAQGDGTKDNPFNCQAAINYVSAMEANKNSENDVYIKGKVVSIKENYGDSSFGNATYYISDDGTETNQFYVFRSLYKNNAKYSSGDKLAVGDTVVVCGKVVNYYGNTPETVQNQSYLYSLNKATGSGSGDTGGTTTQAGVSISGSTVTLTNSAATAGTETISLDLSTLGYSDAQDVSTITLSDGTTITFEGNGEKNTPKYYNLSKGVRVYKNNIVKFNGKAPIAQIVLTCDSYNGTNYVGNATATMSVSGNAVTYTNVYTESSGGGVQLRIKNVKIIYAK